MSDYVVLDWDDLDPAEKINYAVDFSTALDDGDSLQSITYTFLDQQGVTKSLEAVDGTLARVTLTSGTPGATARLMCFADTAGGEKLKQAVRVKIKVKN